MYFIVFLYLSFVILRTPNYDHQKYCIKIPQSRCTDLLIIGEEFHWDLSGKACCGIFDSLSDCRTFLNFVKTPFQYGCPTKIHQIEWLNLHQLCSIINQYGIENPGAVLINLQFRCLHLLLPAHLRSTLISYSVQTEVLKQRCHSYF